MSRYEDHIRRVHEPFERDHERLRAELMARLADTAESPPAPGDVPALPRRRTGSTPMRRIILRIGVAAAAAAALLAIVGLWPSGTKGPGIAWAAVLEQIKNARSVHMVITMHEPEMAGGQPVTIDMYLKTPDKMRQTMTGMPGGGGTQVGIVNGDTMLKLMPEAKTCVRSSSPALNAYFEKMLGDYFMLPGAMSDAAQSDKVKAPLGQATGRLVPDGRYARDGRDLLRYRLEILDESKNTPRDQEATRGMVSYYCSTRRRRRLPC